jgi:hypothetical protein
MPNRPSTTFFVCLPRFECEARTIISNLRRHLHPPPGFSIHHWFNDTDIGIDTGTKVKKKSPSTTFHRNQPSSNMNKQDNLDFFIDDIRFLLRRYY